MKKLYVLLVVLGFLLIQYETNAQYCVPNYTFTPFGCSDANGGDVIDDFWTTGGITNITNMNTACNGDYTYFSTMTCSQTMGQQITFNLQCGPTLAQGYRIWIDYNNDFDFQDLGEDVWASSAATLNVQTATYTIPTVGITPGLKRMRIVGRYNTVPVSTDDCNQSMSFGESEDYNINILPLAPYDPAVYFISQPAGNCFSANQAFQVRLKNYGSSPIILSATQQIIVTLNVNGPGGLVTYDTTLSSGTLPAFGADSIVALFLPAFNNALNLYQGGSYSINTSLTCIGFANGLVSDDSLTVPITLVNYRPQQGPTYNLCQYASIPFGQGLSVSGCATPFSDSVTINFTVTPCIDNVGATGFGTSTTAPANCANQFACTFASGILPSLPVGAYFIQPSKLTITNLSSSFPTECRFNVFGAIPDGPTLYSGCPTPYNVGAGDINVGGSTAGPANNFTYTRNIPTTGISAMYSNLIPGNTVNIGYFELWNDLPAASDIGVNASGPTVVTLKIYYQYVPPNYEWYDVAFGGTSIYNLSPFNPMVTPNAVVNNSNVPGTYIFYAACSGSSNCRIADTLKINPAPTVFQDTLNACESISSSNTAIVDLTSLNSSVSGGLPYDSLLYYYDQATLSLVMPQNADTTGSIVLYSKIYQGLCAATDSVLVYVNSTPELVLTNNSPLLCAPNSGNAVDYINPFSFTPIGSDTLFFQDAACTQPYPNPNYITSADSVYIVIITNNNPSCADTSGLFMDVATSSNLIVNQNNSLISNCSSTDPIPTNYNTFADGQMMNVFNSSDCKKIVRIHDVTNGTSLGTTAVNEWIECPTPYYNGQPYINRHFQITPTNQDSAEVCLYILDDDVAQYNFDISSSAWPQIVTPSLSNVCITKVDNGDITDPAHTFSVIPSNDITVSYDPTYQVYSLCFQVSSFSYFYCHTCNSPMQVALPVNWKSFAGRRVENTSVLNWITSSEKTTITL